MLRIPWSRFLFAFLMWWFGTPGFVASRMGRPGSLQFGTGPSKPPGSTQNYDGMEPDMEKYFLPKDVSSERQVPSVVQPQSKKVNRGQPQEEEEDSRPRWLQHLPKVNFRCDPVINFSIKQRLTLLGARVMIGLDYLTDINEWRSVWSVEDNWLRGRFTLRGSELGWAKSWMMNLGMGEDSAAKIKLRLGLNLKTQRLYAKLRFRTDPVSPVDIGNGLSCAGRIPVPIPSFTKHLPLRIEYLLRINTSREPRNIFGKEQRVVTQDSTMRRKQRSPYQVVSVTTGLGGIDVSLDELNFCLEWEEAKPMWGIGLVRNEPSRKKLSMPLPPPPGSNAGPSMGNSRRPFHNPLPPPHRGPR